MPVNNAQLIPKRYLVCTTCYIRIFTMFHHVSYPNYPGSSGPFVKGCPVTLSNQRKPTVSNLAEYPFWLFSTLFLLKDLKQVSSLCLQLSKGSSVAQHITVPVTDTARQFQQFPTSMRYPRYMEKGSTLIPLTDRYCSFVTMVLQNFIGVKEPMTWFNLKPNIIFVERGVHQNQVLFVSLSCFIRFYFFKYSYLQHL